MANSVDPDETARYEPYNLDLLRMQRYLIGSSGLKGLKCKVIIIVFSEENVWPPSSII